MLTICLPEYNEGEVLFEFVDKLNKEFGNAIMVIVDDHSPEQFQYDVKAKYGNLENFILIFNSQNLGHGQSTLIGLNKAIETENEIIIAVDRLSGGALKLIDRLEFSQQNFNAAKNWSK